MPEPVPYQYFVLRCVPRVDRQEFLNVGVVLYSQRAEFLGCASHLDTDRLLWLDAELDVAAVIEALATTVAICRGDASVGVAGTDSLGLRFGHLSAPRSTVVQPGPVHGGITTARCPEPGAMLDHLLASLVGGPRRTPGGPAAAG